LSIEKIKWEEVPISILQIMKKDTHWKKEDIINTLDIIRKILKDTRKKEEMKKLKV